MPYFKVSLLDKKGFCHSKHRFILFKCWENEKLTGLQPMTICGYKLSYSVNVIIDYKTSKKEASQ